MSSSSSGWVRSLSGFAAGLGLEPERLFRDVGLDAGALQDPLARFSQEGLNRLWDRLVEATGDPAVGLRFGESVSPASFGAVGYVMLASPTLGDAVRQALRFQRYLAEAMRGGLRPAEDGMLLALENTGDRNGVRPQATEAMLAACLTYARWIVRAPVVPRRVYLRHGLTAPEARYRAFFGCEVVAGAGITGLLFDAELLSRPLPSHDPALLSHHLQLAERQSRDSHHTVSARVRDFIREALPGGVPSQSCVAARLHLTPKTLQRRLDQEGTGFKTLAEEVRFECARAYLARREPALQEVAGLCGYQEYSAFAKAFRGWAGCSPGEWRERHAH